MADSEVPPGLVREHLGHILASASLGASEALRRLLRCTVETTLAGRGEGLKEYTIGVEALGRPASFDPRQDNIVRVQARKLRERLATYYDGEGRKETCRIVYRSGSYLPVFTAAMEPSSPPRTVAVLPLMNLTSDSGVGYFCDGLAEEIIDLLARSDGLRVVARTSSFEFKGAPMDARDIGRRLGAGVQFNFRDLIPYGMTCFENGRNASTSEASICVAAGEPAFVPSWQPMTAARQQ